MLKTKVKASSISNLTDARYFASWHVDCLGFDLSARGLATLPLASVKEIKDWIEGPKIVGELEVFDIEQSQQLIDFLSLEYIQVGMHTPVGLLNSLKVKSIIKEVVIEPITTVDHLKKHLAAYFDYVDFFLVNFDKNGIEWANLEKGFQLTIPQLAAICNQYEVFLSIDFTSDNTEKIIKTLQPEGINLKGGIEEKVGFKSFDELDEILETLEVD